MRITSHARVLYGLLNKTLSLVSVLLGEWSTQNTEPLIVGALHPYWLHCGRGNEGMSNYAQVIHTLWKTYPRLYQLCTGFGLI